jgi:hypothetical protein
LLLCLPASTALAFDGGWMCRLVETNLAPTGYSESSFPPPRLLSHLSTLDLPGFQGPHGCIQVVTHQVEDRAQELMVGMAPQVAFFFGMQGCFSGWQRKDQPSSTGIHCAKSENVAEEDAICFGVCAVQQDVSAGNHGVYCSRSYAACSYAWATRKIVASSKWRPRICSPIGSFSLVVPQGTEIPGMPARSAVTV